MNTKEDAFSECVGEPTKSGGIVSYIWGSLMMFGFQNHEAPDQSFVGRRYCLFFFVETAAYVYDTYIHTYICSYCRHTDKDVHESFP